MPRKGSEREAAQEALRGAARALFISGDAIGAFLASATPGQVAACTAMLESEIAHRDRAKRARPLGRARFPVPKSVEGFDWPDVAFPDGWGRDEMLSLAFVRDAEDLVFYGQTGRGKTHMATALGIAATSAGRPVRFRRTAQLALQLGKAKREGGARPAARRRGQGEAPGPGRVRLRALRRGRGEAPAPGHIGQLREEERDIHHQRRVQQMGHGLRRRQTRGGHRRPRGAPRQARGVRRTQPQARGVSHAGKVGKMEAAARP